MQRPLFVRSPCRWQRGQGRWWAWRATRGRRGTPSSTSGRPTPGPGPASYCTSVSRAVERGALGDRADIVVVDPPRQGLERAVLDGIVALEPRRIVYASCDPSTQARDLKGLVGHGYRVKQVRPFDLFPQTYHIESVTLLQSPTTP